MEESITVSQLNDNIKYLLEETFDLLRVEGEISNLRRPQSGHLYFTLKDEKSQIKAVFFRQYGGYVKRNNFELEEGLKVLCRARLNVYLPRGEYQLVVESVEPLGVGALQKAFEQLKAKLFSEGLFDECHKKSLPFLPEKIGVITSPSGAVIRDILNITKRRFPTTDILIAPVRVQGSEAVADIMQALRNLHSYGNIDIIIIARGGGSLEDLAPFNDESLARAVFSSSIPIISAVGHETDFTICDFVADLRAPTPSAAAELVVPRRLDLIANIDRLRQRMASGICRHLEFNRDQLVGLQDRLKDPRRFVVNLKIKLDDLKERLTSAFDHERQLLSNEIKQLELRLRHRSPAAKISDRKIFLNNIQKNLLSNFLFRLSGCKETLRKNSAILESLSPLAVLQRGYSITTHIASSKVVRQTDGLTIGEAVNVRLARGHFDAKIEKICE